MTSQQDPTNPTGQWTPPADAILVEDAGGWTPPADAILAEDPITPEKKSPSGPSSTGPIQGLGGSSASGVPSPLASAATPPETFLQRDLDPTTGRPVVRKDDVSGQPFVGKLTSLPPIDAVVDIDPSKPKPSSDPRKLSQEIEKAALSQSGLAPEDFRKKANDAARQKALGEVELEMYVVDGKPISEQQFEDLIYDQKFVDDVQKGFRTVKINDNEFVAQFMNQDIVEAANRNIQSGTRLGDKWEKFLSGASGMAAGVTGLETMYYDVVEEVLGIPLRRDLFGVAELQQTSEDLARKAGEYEKKTFQYRDNFLNSVMNGNWSDAVQQAPDAVAASIPYSAAAAALTYAGGPALSFSVLAPLSSSAEYADMKVSEDEAYAELSRAEMLLRSNVVGPLQAATDIVAGRALSRSFDLTKGLYRGLVKEVAEKQGLEAADKAAKELSKNIIRKYGENIGLQMTEEFFAEGGSTAGVMMYDDIMGIQTYNAKDYISEILNSGLLGAASGGITTATLGGPTAIYATGLRASNKLKSFFDKRLAEDPSAIEKLSNRVDGMPIPDEAKEQAKEGLAKREKAVKAVPKDKVSDTETVDTVQEIQELEEEKKGLLPVYQEPIQAEIDAKTEKLKEGIKDGVAAEETPLPSLTKTDSKGRKFTYYSTTKEKDGVTTTSFSFNRSDKAPNQRNATGVPVKDALGDGYEIDRSNISEDFMADSVTEVRKSADGSQAAATVVFKNSQGGSFELQVPLIPSNKPTPTEPTTQPSKEPVSESELNKGGAVNPALKDVESTANALGKTIPKKDLFAVAVSLLPKKGVINYKDINKTGLPLSDYLNNPKLALERDRAKGIYEDIKSGKSVKYPRILLDENNKLLDGTNRTIARLANGETDFEFSIAPKGFLGKPYAESISEAYHKAKADRSNPELVKAVEELLTPSSKPSAETRPVRQEQGTRQGVREEDTQGKETPREAQAEEEVDDQLEGIDPDLMEMFENVVAKEERREEAMQPRNQARSKAQLYNGLGKRDRKSPQGVKLLAEIQQIARENGYKVKVKMGGAMVVVDENNKEIRRKPVRRSAEAIANSKEDKAYRNSILNSDPVSPEHLAAILVARGARFYKKGLVDAGDENMGYPRWMVSREKGKGIVIEKFYEIADMFNFNTDSEMWANDHMAKFVEALNSFTSEKTGKEDAFEEAERIYQFQVNGGEVHGEGMTDEDIRQRNEYYGYTATDQDIAEAGELNRLTDEEIAELLSDTDRINQYENSQQFIQDAERYAKKSLQEAVEPEQGEVDADLLRAQEEGTSPKELAPRSDKGLPDKPSEGARPAARPDRGDRATRPGLVVATREKVPTPDNFIEEGDFPIDAEQTFAVNVSMTRFRSGKDKDFMLADGTGVGKTRQILAIADTYKKEFGKPVLIVSENKQILENNFADDAKAMGIDPKSFDMATYADIRTGKVKGPYGLILFDEAHNLKNPESDQTIAANSIERSHTLYATATPMDTVAGSAYFISRVTNMSLDDVYRRIGFKVELKKLDDGRTVRSLVLEKGTDPKVIRANIVSLRDEMIESGAMLRREYPFWGTIQEASASLTSEQESEIGEIEDYWEEVEEEARNENGSIPPKKLMSIRGQRSGELSRWNESQKVKYVFDGIKKALKEGKKVVVIAEGINSTYIKGIDREVPGFIGSLEKLLEKEGVSVAKIYGDNNKTEANRAFQEGTADVVLGTAKSASTGINLDDQVGDAPRKLFMVTPNYSGNIFQQILGRVSRRNTKSPAEVELVFNDSSSDTRRKEIVSGKLATLKAIQEGIIEDDVNLDGIRVEEDSSTKSEGVFLEDISDKAFVVKGDTFKIKEQLKALGGRWNSAQKAWMFPKSKKSEIEKAIIDKQIEALKAEIREGLNKQGVAFDPKNSAEDARQLGRQIGQLLDLYLQKGAINAEVFARSIRDTYEKAKKGISKENLDFIYGKALEAFNAVPKPEAKEPAKGISKKEAPKKESSAKAAEARAQEREKARVAREKAAAAAKESKAKAVDKATEAAKQKYVNVGYRIGEAFGKLAGEIRGKAEGRKEGVKEGGRLQKQFAEQVDEILQQAIAEAKRKSPGFTVTASQLAASAKKLLSVNFNSPLSIERAVEYVDKVLNNATYAYDVSKANKLKKDNLKRLDRNDYGIDDGSMRQALKLNAESLSVEELADYLNFLSEISRGPYNRKKHEATVQKYAEMYREQKLLAQQGRTEEEKEASEKRKEAMSQSASDAKQEAIDEFEFERADMNTPVSEAYQKDYSFIKTITEAELESLSEGKLRELSNSIRNMREGIAYASGNTSEVIRNLKARRMAEAGKKITEGRAFKQLLRDVFMPFKVSFSGLRERTATDRAKKLASMMPMNRIDSMMKGFTDSKIHDTFIQPISTAYSSFTEKMNQLDKGYDRLYSKVGKSLIPWKREKQRQDEMVKLSLIAIQKEFEANVGNDEVSSVADYMEAIAEAAKFDSDYAPFAERYLSIYESMLDKDGNFDYRKQEELLDKDTKTFYEYAESISQANADYVEVSAIRNKENISLRQAYTPISVALIQYSNLSEIQDMANKFSSDENVKPTAQSGNIKKRTRGSKPLYLDFHANAKRATRSVLMDYYMREPLRTASKAFNVIAKDTEMSPDARSFFSAIEANIAKAVRNTFVNEYYEPTGAKAITELLKKRGYQMALASIPRAGVEFASNFAHAAMYKPKELAMGAMMLQEYKGNDEDLRSLAIFAESAQVSRMFEKSTSLMAEQGSGTRGAATVYGRAIDQFSDAIMSSPDRAIARPLWLGSFSRAFEAASGEKLDISKMVNDPQYRLDNEAAIQRARNVADANLSQGFASLNPFEGVVASQVTKDDNIAEVFDKYMTRFMRYEFQSAVDSLNGLVGKNELSKAEAARLLGATILRMSAYQFAMSYAVDGFYSLIESITGTGPEEEEEDDDELSQKIGSSVAGTIISLLVFRRLGNWAKAPIAYAIETLNSRFGEELGMRNGEYDPYKDSMVFSTIPGDATSPDLDPKKVIPKFMGPYGAVTKTGFRLAELSARGGVPSPAGGYIIKPSLKDPDAIDKAHREIAVRIVPELFMETIGLPVPRDVRNLILRDVFKDYEEGTAQGRAVEGVMKAKQEASEKRDAALAPLQEKISKANPDKFIGKTDALRVVTTQGVTDFMKANPNAKGGLGKSPLADLVEGHNMDVLKKRDEKLAKVLISVDGKGKSYKTAQIAAANYYDKVSKTGVSKRHTELMKEAISNTYATDFMYFYNRQVTPSK